MRKTILLAVILLICTSYGFAASPAAGTWDCVAVADQEYFFTIYITEKDGELTGIAEGASGESGPVDALKLENGVLTFAIDSPDVGNIKFEATLDGDTLKGTYSTSDFGGEFSAALRK